MKGAVVIIALSLLAGCYATTGTPPGPNCNVDPSNPACFPPLTDTKKPDGGAPR